MTVLRGRKPLAKVWKADGPIVPAADGAWFEARGVSVANVSELRAVIWTLESSPRDAIVKEAIAGGADPNRLRRRCEGGTDMRTGEEYPAGLRVVPRRLVVLDVEKLPRPASIDWRDGDALAAYVRRLLPDAFRNVATVWQMSGSSGHPAKRDEIRQHQFFMLDEAVLPKAWRPSLAHLPFIDLTVFDNAKIIFTARPIIQCGRDPLARRHGLLEGEPVVRVPKEVLNRSDEIAEGESNAMSMVVPVTSAPMPAAAAGFIDIVARSNILRSQHPAYCNQRSRRLAFCTLLRDSFGIQDEATLETAFHTACVGTGDPNGSHDAQQALAWARTPLLTEHRFSARKLLCEASVALHTSGDRGTAARAARLAMVFFKIESQGACA